MQKRILAMAAGAMIVAVPALAQNATPDSQTSQQGGMMMQGGGMMMRGGMQGIHHFGPIERHVNDVPLLLIDCVLIVHFASSFQRSSPAQTR